MFRKRKLIKLLADDKKLVIDSKQKVKLGKMRIENIKHYQWSDKDITVEEKQ